MWRVVVDVNMHTKFRIREKNSLLPTWYVRKMKQTNDNNNSHINDNNNSPHGKFHRFLFPFSSKFPDLNFAPYVIYRNPYLTQTVSLGHLWYNVYIMWNGRCFQTSSLFFQPIFRYREISRLLLKPLLTALNLLLGTTSLFIVRLCLF